MPKLPVTVLLAVRNEEKNIRKCLNSLTPAKEVVVLDSMSTDDTARIAAEEFGATVIQFQYSGKYPKKRQWALNELQFKCNWILLIDGDEEVPEALWREIEQVLVNKDGCNAYMIRKGFHFLGKRFRFGGFSHSAVLLIRNGCGRFEELVEDCDSGLDMEVHERVIVEGNVGSLKTPLVHEDFKGLQAYLTRHNQYSSWEAQLRHNYLQSRAYGASAISPRLLGNSQERRRWFKQMVMRIPGEPMVWFIYHYIIRLGILEGRRGLIACRIRAEYIFQVRAKMFELKMSRS